MRHTALAALCLASAATVGLTGCQSSHDDAASTPDTFTSPPGKASRSSKPKEPFAGLAAEQIAEKAITTTSGASWLRMKAVYVTDKSKDTKQTDFAMNKKKECTGTVSLGQGKTDLIKTGDTGYMKSDEEYLRAQYKGTKAEVDEAVDTLAGQWTKMSVNGEDPAPPCDLDAALGGVQDIISDVSPGGREATAVRGRATTVGGVPALVVHAKEGKDRYALYIATEGKPHLLRMVSKSADYPATFTFSNFNEPVRLQKPAGDIVDLDTPRP